MVRLQTPEMIWSFAAFFLFMTLVGGIEFVFHREEERKEDDEG